MAADGVAIAATREAAWTRFRRLISDDFCPLNMGPGVLYGRGIRRLVGLGLDMGIERAVVVVLSVVDGLAIARVREPGRTRKGAASCRILCELGERRGGRGGLPA